MSGLRAAFVMGVVLSCSVSAGFAQPPTRVLVTVHGSAHDLPDVLRDLLLDLDVDTSIETTEGFDVQEVLDSGASAQSLARAWVDMTQRGRATIYISDTSSDRILIRRVTLAEELGAVAVEEIGQIIASSMEALLAGGRIGISRAEVIESLGRVDAPSRTTAPIGEQPPRPSAEANASANHGLAFHTEVGIRPVLWSLELPPQLHLFMRTVLSSQDDLAPGVALMAAYLPSARILHNGVGADIEGLALRLSVSIAPRTRPFSFVASVGAGLDILQVSPFLEGDGGGLTLEPSHWRPMPMLTSSIGVLWHLGESVALRLDGGVEVELEDTSYVSHRTSGLDTIFDPWSVRPFLDLALRVTSEDF